MGARGVRIFFFVMEFLNGPEKLWVGFGYVGSF
jgi:hypothetical protein